MKRFLLIIISCLTGYSQLQNGFLLNLDNSLVSNRLNGQQYLDSEIELHYRSDWWLVGLTYHTTSQYRFRISQEPIELSSPDITNIVNLDEINFNPDRYELSNSFSLLTGFTYRDLSLAAEFYHVQEKNYLETVEIANNSLFVRGQNSEEQRYFVDFNIRFNSRYLNFKTGLKQLKLSASEESALSYRLDMDSYPFIALFYHPQGLQLSSVYDQYVLQFEVQKQLESYPVTLVAELALGQKSDFTAYGFTFSYRLANNFDLKLAYQRNDNRIDQFKRSNFLRELNSGFSENLFNNSRFTLGISYNYSIGNFLDNLIFDVQLPTDAVYLSKQRLYQSNPAGTVFLMNTGGQRQRFYLELSSDDNFISYKSDFIELASGDSLSVPMYLFMNSGDLPERDQYRQLELKMVRESAEDVLYQSNLHLFDRHFWSGDPADLVYFIETENQQVKGFASEQYRKTNRIEGTIFQQKFKRLTEFLVLIAADKQYLSDPVHSIIIDEVQYPDELLLSKSGDCEDLLVFYISALQSIGQQCAIIALKPDAANPVGHVFLLMDTGIPVSEQESLALTDIGAVKRQNYLGDYTLWLPLEITTLNQGFEAAYKSGVQQYYQQVIVNEGLQSAAVRIIDLY